MQWHQESDLRRPTKLASRAIAYQLLHVLREGDTVVVPEFAGAFDFPSDAVASVQAMTARGIDVRILDLSTQPAATLLPILRAMGTAFAPLERELRVKTEELAEVQGRAEARFQVALSEAVAEIARAWGPPPSLTAGVRALGDVREPLDGESESTGSLIRKKREAVGMSQKQLAELLGVSQPQLSRVETDNPEAPKQLRIDAFNYLFRGEEVPANPNGAL